MVDVTLPNGQTLSMPSVTDEDEAKRIAANYYKKNKDLQPVQETLNESEPEIDRSGVSNSALRRFLARADNNEEYELRLRDSGFTPDMYMKDPEGVGYVIDRDKLTPELREKYDIQGRGLLSVEDEGISANDFKEFFAGNRGAIIGGTAASLAATGFGLPVAALITAGGSALGYLADEGLEYSGGLNAQSGSDVLKQAAFEGLYGAVGEGGGRLIAKGFGRLLKGPGGKEANEVRQSARQMINEGARPTVRATNTAPILGRMQAIYEGVFPNQKAAQQNADFIGKKIQEMKASRELGDEVDYDAIMQMVNRDIVKIYGTPDQLLKQAEKNLADVVDKQIDGVMNLMGKPDPKGGKVVAEALDIAKRTFDEDVGELFSKANQMLGEKPIVDMSNVKKQASSIVAKNPALDLEQKGFFKYVKSMPEVVDVQIANSLRTAINHASFDPSIVGSVDKQLLTKLNTSIADGIRSTEAAARTMLKPGSIKGPDGKFLGKQQFQDMSEGFDMLRKAQSFYNKGIDRFQQPLTEKIYQNYITGKNFNPNDLLDPKFGIIVPDNSRGLNRFLNTVVPSGRDIVAPPQSLKDIVPNIKVTLPTGGTGKLPDLVEQLPAEDALRRYYDSMLVDQQRFSGRIAQARKNGVEIREATRRQLAGMYLTRAFDESRDLLGGIDAAKVAGKINALGDTKKALFKGEEKQLMEALSDMAGMGKNVTPDQLAQLSGKPITEQLQVVNTLTQQSKDLKGLPLLRNLEKAVQDQDADRILNAVLKKNNASVIKNAKRLLGDTPTAPSGTMESVRDLAMRKIISSAGDPDMVSGEDFVKAIFDGKHATALERQLNAYGRETLGELFGKETTDGLYNLVKYSRSVSNDPIKGLGGLAPAVIATGLGVAGMMSAPFATLTTAGALLAMSRLLRTGPVLKLFSKPTATRGLPQTGVKPRPTLKGTPGIDYDQLGAALEGVYRIIGQYGAAGYSSGQEKGVAAIERAQEMSSATPSPTSNVSVSSRNAVIGAPGRLSATRQNIPNSALLGSDPMSQALNEAIAQRLNR